MKKLFILIYILSFLVLFSCKQKSVEIVDFKPFVNYSTSGDTLQMPLYLNYSIHHGITIPEPIEGVNTEPYFKFSFTIKNNSVASKAFYYKVFYQNISYKHDEKIKNDSMEYYNISASENFYGSWEELTDTLHLTQVINNDNKPYIISDSFRIVGNPRNEAVYFGKSPDKYIIKDDEIKKTIDFIKEDKAWMNSIATKAKEKGTSVYDQLMLDARWVIEQNNKDVSHNNRWKRNARTGLYRFMIVVGELDDFKKLPNYALNIQKKHPDGYFMDPFYFYNEKSNLEKTNIQVVISNYYLNVFAKLNPSRGVFVESNAIYKKNNFNILCGTSEKLYYEAHFAQLFHYIYRDSKNDNIPVTMDVTGQNYHRKQYDENIKRYDNKRIHDYIQVTDCPCATVGVNEKNNLYLKNPGNVKNTKKENVGVKGRIGFTYGRFIAKIKFPKTLSNDNVWNGVTNAFWLLFQSENEWNFRTDTLAGKGYIPKDIEDKGVTRVKSTHYSEIDFEIVKTSKFWPKTSYSVDEYNKLAIDTPDNNNNLIITCTNWDLACDGPKNFIVGAKPYNFQNNTFELHRWDHWYKAITSKHEISQKELTQDFYYYEIEWKPNQILWKIGADKNNMRIISAMDTSVTCIPNNQMIPIVSQEFHYSEWWPTAPFIQRNIPFPANDIVGEVEEIMVY